MKLLSKLVLISLLILTIPIISGCGAKKVSSDKKAIEQAEASDLTTISFNGQEGKTALEALKSFHNVETKSYGELGEFIDSIDSIKPDAKHFWAFYVNGKNSSTGAGEYNTHDDDTLEFKVEPIKK